MPRDGGGGINRDAILVVEPVEQFFGRKLRIEQFMILDRIEQQLGLHPVVVLRGADHPHPRARRPTKTEAGLMPPSRGRCCTMMAPARQLGGLLAARHQGPGHQAQPRGDLFRLLEIGVRRAARSSPSSGTMP